MNGSGGNGKGGGGCGHPVGLGAGSEYAACVVSVGGMDAVDGGKTGMAAWAIIEGARG